jgi:hypothetical protein
MQCGRMLGALSTNCSPIYKQQHFLQTKDKIRDNKDGSAEKNVANSKIIHLSNYVKIQFNTDVFANKKKNSLFYYWGWLEKISIVVINYFPSRKS